MPDDENDFTLPTLQDIFPDFDINEFESRFDEVEDDLKKWSRVDKNKGCGDKTINRNAILFSCLVLAAHYLNGRTYLYQSGVKQTLTKQFDKMQKIAHEISHLPDPLYGQPWDLNFYLDETDEHNQSYHWIFLGQRMENDFPFPMDLGCVGYVVLAAVPIAMKIAEVHFIPAISNIDSLSGFPNLSFSDSLNKMLDSGGANGWCGKITG